MSPAAEKVTVIKSAAGLTIVHRQSPRSSVEYCGVVVQAGSRDDPPTLPGQAHFVEHTIFKGTRHRSSWHIINRMERVGGELNAYTTKEETVVYTAAPRGNAARALELIADLIINSRFPDRELDKERDVVADEIDSYLDSPAEAVFDDFEDMIFSGSPLGHNILGNRDALALMHSAECRAYLDSWYAADNMAVFYYGPAPASRIIPMVERYFSLLPAHAAIHTPMPSLAGRPAFDIHRSIDSHQAHTVMGCLTVNMSSPQRFAFALLSNILGGPGMNSLLNVAMREKRGLVYSVETANSLLRDCGLFTVYFGCDPSDTDNCCRLVNQQIAQLRDHPLSDTALNRLKKQYIGQLTVSSDSRDSLAISTARKALYYGVDAAGILPTDQIMAVTPVQISECAAALTNLSRLTLT